MTIGIPRALLYWKQPYFWESFFENLGFEVLLSPKTNKEIVEMGVRISDPEACFSNKVYFGHLLWLDGKCDLIFVPRLKAVAEHSFVEPKARREKKLISAIISHPRFARVTEEKIAEASPHLSPRPTARGSVLEYCPKFFGLPDLSKILAKTPILTETFDERKEKFERTLQRLGKKLKKNKEEVKRAEKISFLKEKEIKEKEEQDFFEKINPSTPLRVEKKKIVLISHPYNLYDEYVNLRIKEKLEKLGTEPIFIDEVPIGINQQNQHKSASNIKFHWEFGKEIMEKIETILNYKIEGAIEISSFACGCDAVLKEFIEREFKQNRIPFMYLIIDEQTGEAGFQTRLEAFVDTI